jgi:hypothetical protein
MQRRLMVTKWQSLDNKEDLRWNNSHLPQIS